MLAVVHGFPVVQAVLVEVQRECGKWENGEWSRQGGERYGEQKDEGGGHAGALDGVDRVLLETLSLNRDLQQ